MIKALATELPFIVLISLLYNSMILKLMYVNLNSNCKIAKFNQKQEMVILRLVWRDMYVLKFTHIFNITSTLESCQFPSCTCELLGTFPRTSLHKWLIVTCVPSRNTYDGREARRSAGLILCAYRLMAPRSTVKHTPLKNSSGFSWVSHSFVSCQEIKVDEFRVSLHILLCATIFKVL